MQEESLGTFEMLWDCPACGTDRLLGIQHRHCPACGSPQDPSARYYPSDEDKVAITHHRYQGADKVCPGCATANAGTAQFCVGCGAPMDGSAKEAAARSEQQAGQGEAFAAESIKDARTEARARRDQKVQQELGRGTPAPSGMSRGLKIGLIAGAIALVVGVLVFVFFLWKKQTVVDVQGHGWVRTIEVQTFKEVRDSAWCDQMPRGARSVTKKKEQRSTKQVADGEECVKKRKDNRDGTFKEVKECKPKYRDEPIYDQKCSFEVDRWVTERSERAEGDRKDPAPAWPAVTLTREGDCKGCQREGPRHESYTLHFVDTREDQSYECEVERSQWDESDVGSKWKAEVGVVTSSLDCDSFEPM